ncbi:TBC domain-containing protein kinase-like protein [Ornithodoros turicata]|uniref:TBC domain-containing protein kinase-like protein n=1 Tax=Ornithodoros turicata TaxID=34597 RepID=UPI003138F594
MTSLKTRKLGAKTFFASCHAKDTCGNNGLPLTPNSIRILGQFQVLKTLSHKNLCTYLDAIRSKHERLVLVFEHFEHSLEEAIPRKLPVEEIAKICCEIVEALNYLHNKKIYHHALSPKSILLDEERHVKVSNYGLYHVTEHARTVPFPLGTPKYLAPEVLIQERSVADGPKIDVWSLGIIALELALGRELWNDSSIEDIFKDLLTLVKEGGDALNFIASKNSCSAAVQELDGNLIAFIRCCLTILPKERPSMGDLLAHPFISQCYTPEKDIVPVSEFLSTKLRCEHLTLSKNPFYIQDHLAERPLQEIYYLWQLAGGDAEAELHKQGCIKVKPPVCTLPFVMLLEGEEFGQKKDAAFYFDDTVIFLPTEQLKQRLKDVEPSIYYPLIESFQEATTSPSGDLHDTATLPIVIREKDIEYQLHRIILYSRLLQAYPFKKLRIVREAKTDIPPLYRGYVWAALLEIQGDLLSEYESIDKETVTPTDRQIEVDIPRCHQYDELLSSPTAHSKFRRLLKAWVISHPQYVYWQGLDSLCAPFLYLHFNNEALAYACLSTFIDKYLHNFFLQDNSLVIKEYLAVFSHLIAYHDPELTNHLDSIGFLPELYSIPWFLTMYTHVFPLHKIFHLWDTLLLGKDSFPFCIGVAILQQLRTDLLSFGFNECILLFSDMPEIDIQRCVRDSIRIFCTTPQGATYREHARPTNSGTTPSSPSLTMSAVPLEVLKSELCPRISAEDLIGLLELGRADAAPNKFRVLVVDVRAPEEYLRGAVQNSINIPYATAFTGDSLTSSPEAHVLAAHKGKMVLVLGSHQDNNASSFANGLVRLGYARVCLLHGGVEVLRTTNVLFVPTAA